jgi:hypothetical protein
MWLDRLPPRGCRFHRDDMSSPSSPKMWWRRPSPRRVLEQTLERRPGQSSGTSAPCRPVRVTAGVDFIIADVR